MTREFDPNSDPAVRKVADEVFNMIVTESDRGAILVGGSVVDDHLRMLIDKLLPEDMNADKKENLLTYPGLLSGFAARLDFARAARMIDVGLYRSIKKLKDIRNDLAHRANSFTLETHDKQLQKIYEISPSMAEYLMLQAQHLVTELTVKKVGTITTEDKDGNKVLAFKTREEAFNAIAQQPELVEKLKGDVRKWQLALAIGHMCGLLAAYREMPSDHFKK